MATHDPTLDAAFTCFEAGTATAQELADALSVAIVGRLRAVLGAGLFAWTDETVARAADAAYDVVSPYVDRLPLVGPRVTLVLHLRGVLTP